MYTVDIDVGGTMTDGLFSDGHTATVVKVDTTPHDLTVCFLACLQEGAEQIGFAELKDFLGQVELIRWSSTVASNVLAEGKGPRLGLLITRGYEGTLYGRGASPALGYLIRPEAVTPLSQPVQIPEVLTAVKDLLEWGVRRICVSLKEAFYDPGDEVAIKKLLEAQYPDHTLGAVPVLLASDLAKHPDDNTRTHYALLNAYVHGPLAASLFKAEDELMFQHGYRRPLLIGHINGGVARIAKTRAVDTIESGPVFGILGSAYFARQYRLPKVIALDVGGTTVKVGVILNGEPLLAQETELFGIPLQVPMVSLRSISLGGGSVVSVNDQGRVRFGPESMGAYPGPACYDLGGAEATVTDAFVTSGWINPDYFQGGIRQLHPELAREVIETAVAVPLGLDAEAAAAQVVDEALHSISEVVTQTLRDYALSPEGFTLFAYGGNGPLLACGVAERLGLAQVYTFSLGAVFSTFGSSISEVAHTYEHAFYEPMVAGMFDRLYQAMHHMREEAWRDMISEGFSPERIRLILEIEVGDDKQVPVYHQTPLMALDPEGQRRELSNLLDTVTNGPQDLVRIQRLCLRATCPVATFQPQRYPTPAAGTELVRKADRRALWAGAPVDTPIYDLDQLPVGSTMAGPAIVEGVYTTCIVPPGWRLQVDPYRSGILTRVAP